MKFSLPEMRALQQAIPFADTCRMMEATYLGRPTPSLVFFRCGCDGCKLWRKKRKAWMRVLPFLKLYECERCGARILSNRVGKKRVRPVYLPSDARHSLNFQVASAPHGRRVHEARHR
jgi:hypothetical protein